MCAQLATRKARTATTARLIVEKCMYAATCDQSHTVMLSIAFRLMKRWATLAAAVLCFSASAVAPAPANYDAFGTTLLQRLASQDNGNVFISPLSIGIALSMAADGARGATRDGILQTLQQRRQLNLADSNAALIHETRSNSDAKLGLADAIWLRSPDPPLASYTSLLRNRYSAEARTVNFGKPSAAIQINRWVNARTLGLIPHLIDRTDPLDFIYLTNALAFQAHWTHPFEKAATEPHRFTNADGTESKVQMMSQVGTFSTSRDAAYRVLRMTYGRGGFAAYIILPNGKNAMVVLRTLTATNFAHDMHVMHPQYLRVLVPRFTARFQQNLNGPLIALGMGNAFSWKADFRNMRAARGIRISNVEHASYVRVDEAGTTAAAATSVEIAKLAISLSPPHPPVFIVDHAFIFAIRDERIGALLFIGVVNRL